MIGFTNDGVIREMNGWLGVCDLVRVISAHA